MAACTKGPCIRFAVRPMALCSSACSLRPLVVARQAPLRWPLNGWLLLHRACLRVCSLPGHDSEVLTPMRSPLDPRFPTDQCFVKALCAKMRDRCVQGFCHCQCQKVLRAQTLLFRLQPIPLFLTTHIIHGHWRAFVVQQVCGPLAPARPGCSRLFDGTDPAICL
eukprot:7632911-Alexandrium_andersonii.AAC.1